MSAPGASPDVSTPAPGACEGEVTARRGSDRASSSLVDLLGEARAALVRHLRHGQEATVTDLADVLGVSEVATRRHLAVLEADGFLASRPQRSGRGRPATLYRLTERALDLFPQRYAHVASELMDFLTSEQGRAGLRSFLRWRLERETEAFEEVVTAERPDERLRQLAEALSAAGYEARVSEDDDGFVLRQGHCAIFSVARDHPELCAFEAATFSRVLGDEVRVRRRATLAEGGHACVCTVTPRRGRGPGPPPGSEGSASEGSTHATTDP